MLVAMLMMEVLLGFLMLQAMEKEKNLKVFILFLVAVGLLVLASQLSTGPTTSLDDIKFQLQSQNY